MRYLLVLVLTSTTYADVLVNYQFPGGSFTPTITAPGVNATSITGASAEPVGNVGPLPDSLFLRQTVLSPTPEAAVANDQFFEFTLTADAGLFMDLQFILFNGSTVPLTGHGAAIYHTYPGFQSELGQYNPDVTGTLPPYYLSVLGHAYGLTPELTVRVYGFAPEVGVGQYFDNVRVTGTVVPEPMSLGLVAAGLLAVRMRQRKTPLA